MTTFDLDNEIKVVNEQKIIDLTNRWLPKNLDADFFVLQL